MHLHRNPFNKIRNGLQKIETRVYDEKRQQVKVGDEIEFVLKDYSDHKFTVKVVDLIIAPNFSELFDTHPAELFGGKDKEDLTGIYQYYTKEEEEKYGVVGIVVEFK